MPNDATDSLARLLAQGSESFRRANTHLLSVPADRARQTAKPERTPLKRIPKKQPAQTPDTRRYVCRFESVRRRLLDEDNLIPKWHCDFLRYCGAIHSDAPGACHIITTQRQALHGESEHVVITIELIA
jgi:hypothetical protein